MIKHWANDYIGLPWTIDGYGPDCFNCWGLLWFVKRKHYGEELAKYQIPADQLADSMRAMGDAIKSGEWLRIDRPVDGCCVAMSHRLNGPIHHVGLFLDVDGGRILHASKGKGVLCQSLPSVRLFYSRIEFYQHGPKSPHH